MNLKTAIFSSICAISGFAAGISYAADNGAGIRFADEHVAKTTQMAAPAEETGRIHQVATPLNDIALLSYSKVTLTGLGLLIHNSAQKNVLVAIHDAQGRRIFAQEYGAGRSIINIKTDRLTSGTYIYSVMIGDSLFTKPFIVTP
jgi:hypothetical protein